VLFGPHGKHCGDRDADAEHDDDRQQRRAACCHGGADRSGCASPERRVLAQDRLFELAQLHPRLEAELLCETLARAAVHLERLGLPAGAVEREHQLRAQPFAQRLLFGQLLELSDERRMTAGVELGVDSILDGCEARLLEAFRGRACEVFAANVDERRPAPERECVPWTFVRDELLERVGVDLARFDPQPVATVRGLHAVGAERLPQLRHVDLQCLGRGRRRLLVPQLVDEDVRRDDAVPAQQQQHEQRAHLRRRQHDGPPVVGNDLEGAEDPELHEAGAYASAMIRRLSRGDEAVLQELCRRYKSRVPSDDEGAHALALDDLHVWVAEVDGELAGFAYAHELPRVDGDTNVFLYELEVDERFRQRGIGRALVEEAKRLAAGRRMFVLTEPDNEAAMRTYAAAGGKSEPDVLFRF